MKIKNNLKITIIESLQSTHYLSPKILRYIETPS